MPNRILIAIVVAALTLLAYSMVMPTVVPPLMRSFGTRIGDVPVTDLFGVAIATFVGGVIARADFRRWALVVAATIWLLQFATLAIVGPRLAQITAADAVSSLWLGLPLGLLVGWFCAQLGRVAALRYAAYAGARSAARPRRAKWR